LSLQHQLSMIIMAIKILSKII